MALTRDVARALRELIAALDRRAPRLEHPGEASIARDAAALRERAVVRLNEGTDPDSSTLVTVPDGVRKG